MPTLLYSCQYILYILHCSIDTFSQVENKKRASHLLVAGIPSQGKSAFIDSQIAVAISIDYLVCNCVATQLFEDIPPQF